MAALPLRLSRSAPPSISMYLAMVFFDSFGPENDRRQGESTLGTFDFSTPSPSPITRPAGRNVDPGGLRSFSGQRRTVLSRHATTPVLPRSFPMAARMKNPAMMMPEALKALYVLGAAAT